MDKAERRAVSSAYKERPPAWGVYAVRCTVTGTQWVGMSRHLDTQQNGLWFALRMGSCLNKALQSAWAEAGEEGFVYEVLHQLPADTPSFRRTDLLKQQAQAWRETLGAGAV
jgi:hypothetical protein